MTASTGPRTPDHSAPGTAHPAAKRAGAGAPTSFYAPVGLDPDFVPRAHSAGAPRRSLWGRLTGLLARS
ncbi:hypothetical protein [Zhihengliuella salsuginis]|uniref:Uncharacterized protein n=1 Tax=Zhihengliuella salsuginis TaxID=578222 RepID=A0ABQ3GMW7_9MICC|nr:hypothetical protein [Zhihengliuella salsuginis]GHD12356.1 hypothetical protein GCM10008096_27610 [Zhihengliuella salsuginis]